MPTHMHFLPRFYPRNLTQAWNQINLCEEIRFAFITYSQVYGKTLMEYQQGWARDVLELEENSPPVNILKQLAQILKNQLCYHRPMFVSQPDLAREREQHVFVYLSREKMQKVLREQSITFGMEAVVATTIQPYRCDLSVKALLHAHNLAWPLRRMVKSDLECFIAIFASTLFVHLLEAKLTNLYGREAPCAFFVRLGTENRRYDVIACGLTKFDESDRVVPPPAAAQPDLNLRLSVQSEEDVMKPEIVYPKNEA